MFVLQAVYLRADAYVQVSCITATQPYRPHPHRLLYSSQEGNPKDTINGIVSTCLRPENPLAEFTGLKIQYTSREGIKDALAERERVAVYPFDTPNWEDCELDDIDLSTVRLCFEVVMRDRTTGIFSDIQPLVSEPVYLVPPAIVDVVSSDSD